MSSHTPPTRTLRRRRDYTRLERYRPTVLTPRTWDSMLGDSMPLGTAPLSVDNYPHQ